MTTNQRGRKKDQRRTGQFLKIYLHFLHKLVVVVAVVIDVLVVLNEIILKQPIVSISYWGIAIVFVVVVVTNNAFSPIMVRIVCVCDAVVFGVCVVFVQTKHTHKKKGMKIKIK